MQTCFKLFLHFVTTLLREENMTKLLISSLLLVASNGLFAEGKHSGDHAGAHWMSPEAATAIPNPVKYDSASVDRGKKSYFQYCASCHGAKADGNGPAGSSLKPKPANLSVMAGMHPDGDFAWKIQNGRGTMPGWKTVLSDTQIWELVNYIKSLKAVGQSDTMKDMKSMMKDMDISKMSKPEILAFMKKMMPDMDHSAMSKENLQNMLTMMQSNVVSDAGHSNADGHHKQKTASEPKEKEHGHDKAHSH